ARLAALGRVAEARKILEPLASRTPPHPAACNFLGTLDEDEERWQSAYDWYLRAETACDAATPSPEIAAERFRALKGRGFSGRKLGRNVDAVDAGNRRHHGAKPWRRRQHRPRHPAIAGAEQKVGVGERLFSLGECLSVEKADDPVPGVAQIGADLVEHLVVGVPADDSDVEGHRRIIL
ncbi:hypothetical protein B4Q13_23810, partial [Lacticaseibacillus rhamnosus]